MHTGHVAVFPFVSGQLPPKPMALPSRDNPLGGDTDDPIFRLYMEKSKQNNKTFRPHGGDALRRCASAHT